MSNEHSGSLSESGVLVNFDPELRRAFDFPSSTVPSELKNTKRLRFQPGMLKVSGDGVFYTLQGEGRTIGMPAVFLRLHVCNLQCNWCDAWYTWNPNASEFWTESEDWPVERTAAEVKSAWSCKNELVPKRLVVTGGEPLL